MYVVREPSVPCWDRGGKSILSYPILIPWLFDEIRNSARAVPQRGVRVAASTTKYTTTAYERVLSSM